MADVASGLGTPEAGEDVNSPGGFEAAIAAKVGRTEELEGREPTLSTDIRDGLTTEGSDARARDEAGRFAPAAEADEEEDTPEAEEPEEDDAPEGEEPAGDEPDPEMQSLLEKHDGDAEAALAEALQRHKNAESLIGRQGNDLGRERAAREALEARLAAVEARTLAPQTPASLPRVSEDELIEMIEERGAQDAAVWAVNNRPDVYDRLLELWVVDEPIQAQRFDMQYQRWLLDRNAPAQQPAQQDEWVAQQKAQAAITSSIQEFASQTEDWKTIEPHLTAALEQVPKVIGQMLGSDDPQERLDAIGLVADKARILSVGTAQAKTKQRAAATERKQAARVASGSLRPVAPAAKSEGDQTSEEIQREFKRQLLATETTSVSEGLTFGK